MWFELLIFIMGVAFGFFRRGKEDKWGLLKLGAVAGLVLGIVFAIIALFLAPGALGLGIGLAGGFAIFIGILILVVVFIAGVFIGDVLEGALGR